MSMTENEAIKVLEKHIRFLSAVWKPYPDPKVFEAMREALASLEEIQEYKELGTVEEFKVLKEKMKDIEIAIIGRMQEFYDEYRSISQSSVDHFGGKADAIEVSQKIVKGIFKDFAGIDWQEGGAKN